VGGWNDVAQKYTGGEGNKKKVSSFLRSVLITKKMIKAALVMKICLIISILNKLYL
jgi:hypothetical protein